MGARRINPNLIKLNRSYEIGELARRIGVHKNTVRNWMRHGLEPIDGKRPVLIAGSVIRAYLRQRNTRQRCRCEPGEFYCFGCRTPRKPAAGSLVCHSRPDIGQSARLLPVMRNRNVSPGHTG